MNLPPLEPPAAHRPAAAVAGLPRVDLTQVDFEDAFVRALPGDTSGNLAPRLVPGVAWSSVLPTPVAAPRLLAWSEDCAALLGLARPADPTGPAVEVLAGNRMVPGMRPYAARYGGHQFGNWAGQLGDGRAIVLGELLRPDADGRSRRFELQLKGAGRTPYSRFADGRAVLRSSLREFLCSEAMHHLGVPTTRALSLVASGEDVVRDMFYDGNARPEPGAIVCRVAPSFVRFGNFEIHSAFGEHEPLRALADFVLREHYPELLAGRAPDAGIYAEWFAEICRRTGRLLVDWMRLGFVHGVMNTDNLSILGLTIDYGPYGWLEGYDPAWTPNTTDAQGRRYAYGNQPQIALWNLSRLAGALLPLVPEQAALEAGLERYAATFNDDYRAALGAKLGLEAVDRDGDDELLAELVAVLQQVETDFTLFFRGLARVPVAEGAAPERRRAPLEPAWYDAAALDEPKTRRLLAWLERWAARVRAESRPADARIAAMDAVNPRYVPRNWLAQLAIDAAEQGDTGVLERLLEVLKRPYDEQPGGADLATRRPEWARHRAGCSALSCSS